MEGHLAQCVVSEEDLRDVGTLGFGVRRQIIDAALFNHHTKFGLCGKEIKNQINPKKKQTIKVN